MNSLVFLIPLSILLLVGAGVALFWAVDHGQFDDMDTPGLLPLVDTAPEPTDVAPGNAPVSFASHLLRSTFEPGVTKNGFIQARILVARPAIPQIEFCASVAR